MGRKKLFAFHNIEQSTRLSYNSSQLTLSPLIQRDKKRKPNFGPIENEKEAAIAASFSFAT